MRNARGIALQAIEADPHDPAARRYELQILERGGLAVRPGSWHDLFNVLVWRTFPRAKAALNEAHCTALLRDPAEAIRRGRVRDALTLLDESGAIMAASDASLLEAIAAFRWKEVFWTRRPDLLRSARVHVFGHSLYEKLRSPYLGITGYAVLLEVEQKTIDAPPAAQLDVLDALLAALIRGPSGLRSPRSLQPLPVLGWPDWHPATMGEAFYDDIAYFRPGRSRHEHHARSADQPD